jgi:hypothetical protein
VSSSGNGYGFWIVFPVLLIWFIIDYWKDILTFIWECISELFHTLVNVFKDLSFILSELITTALLIAAVLLIIKAVQFFREN